MKWILLLLGILALLVVGHFDRPEEYSFPLPAENQEEVLARQQSSCVYPVAYNK